jgi:hypothetical protein
MANILSAAQKATRSAEMAKRAQALARAAELRAIASLGTRARVKGLAQAAEADMKAKVSLANSGKAAHAGLSNTAKASRGRKFYEGQKASKIKPYTGPAGTGPKAPQLGKGGRNQVTAAGQSAFEKATGKAMFGPNGEGMPLRQRSAWIRKNQGK